MSAAAAAAISPKLRESIAHELPSSFQSEEASSWWKRRKAARRRREKTIRRLGDWEIGRLEIGE
jgi:hypothetical protein